MQIIIAKDAEEMSKKAALMVAGEVLRNPETVLGLATGSTPLGTYKELITMYQNGMLDFSQVTTFNLDEYEGLEPDNPQSYHYYMEHNFFKYINIKKEHTHVPDAYGGNYAGKCRKYEKQIETRGPIRLQILGLGLDGHIGFNEPADYFPGATMEVELAESTIEANKRFFKNREEVPKKAISMGIGTIMKARKILLLVNGTAKAEALKAVVEGPITPQVPGSILQLHPDVTVIADQEAAALLD